MADEKEDTECRLPTLRLMLTGQTDHGKSTWAGYVLSQFGHLTLPPIVDVSTYSQQLDKEGDGCIMEGKSKTYYSQGINFTYTPPSSSQPLSVVLMDTPGHSLYIGEYIKAMLQPTHVTCLVVSSIESEAKEAWEKGTLKEQLLICRASGCLGLLVVWTKSTSSLSLPTHTTRELLLSFIQRLKFRQAGECAVAVEHGVKAVELFMTSVLSVSGPLLTTATSPLPLTSHFLPIPIQAMLIYEGFDVVARSQPLDTLIISNGYRGVMHHREGEWEVEVEGLDTFYRLKRGQSSIGPIRMILRDSSLNKSGHTFHRGDRVILRNSSNVMWGFGVVQ